MKRRIGITMVLAFVMTMAGSCFCGTDVKAGASDIVVDSKSFAKELDTSKWNAPNEDVSVKNGKLIFSADSTGNTRLITKRSATVSKQHDELVNIESTVNIKNIPEGETFIFALGLEGTESFYGENGNFEIVFRNEDGLQVGVRAYDDSGAEMVLAKLQSAGTRFGSTLKLAVHIDTDMKTKVVINNKTLYDKKAPVNMEGRMGFLQTGSCWVEISDLSIISHEYETPENANIVEDFESGSININTLTSKMTNSCLYYPAGLAVEEYNGSNVLMFRNANLAYFGTLYQYSNFEITFDIPYMLHSNITREDGTIQKPAHLKFMLAFGDEAQDYDDYGYLTAAEGISFGSGDISSLKENFEPIYFNGEEFYDKAKNEGYSVKVTVIDTMVTISLKAMAAKEYKEMVSYKIGDATPMGYIHIWSTGQANFAIDNFCVTNKDKDAKLIETEYKAKTIDGVVDWEYEPMQADYLEMEESDTGLLTPMILVYVAIAGVAIILICLLIAKLQKTPKKEDKTDEA